VRLVAAFALVVGAVAVSGCGGGGGGKPLSDSEFVGEANTVCADVYKKYASVSLAHLERKAGVLTDGVERLKELVPPPAKERAFQRFLKAVEGEAGAWEEMVKSGASSDLTDRFIEHESQISSAAAAMGTKKCATIAGTE
jgi:hypothetical protein